MHSFFIACYTCEQACLFVEVQQSVPSYIGWFYRVSHSKLVASIEEDPPRLTNMEVLIEEENVNDTMDIL